MPQLASLQATAICGRANDGHRALEVAHHRVENSVVFVQRQGLQVEVQLFLGVDQRQLSTLAAAISIATDAFAVATQNEGAVTLDAVIFGDLGPSADCDDSTMGQRFDPWTVQLKISDIRCAKH